MDADALLARIGLRERPPATSEGLRAVHRAYLGRVPYEDLAIQLGETGPLDLEDVAQRVLHGGRGGYCFELNGLLGALLEALGFEVARHEAVVGPRGSDGPVNHLALVAFAGGEAWLPEAGYGEGWMEPLPLQPGRHAGGTTRFEWSIEREGDGGWWVGQHEWGATDGIAIRPERVGLGAFSAHHERLSCSPDSSFVQTLVVQQPSDDAITTLRARTFSVVGPGVGERRTLEDVEDLAATLRDAFGIDPEALGERRLDVLWGRAWDQHAAWLAAQP